MDARRHAAVSAITIAYSRGATSSASLRARARDAARPARHDGEGRVRLLPLRPLPLPVVSGCRSNRAASRPRVPTLARRRDSTPRATRDRVTEQAAVLPASARVPGRRDRRRRRRALLPMRAVLGARDRCSAARSTCSTAPIGGWRVAQLSRGVSAALGGRVPRDRARHVRALRPAADGAAQVQHPDARADAARASSSKARSASSRRTRRGRACCSSPAISASGRSTRWCTRSCCSRCPCWRGRSTTRCCTICSKRMRGSTGNSRDLPAGRDPAGAARARREPGRGDPDRSAHPDAPTPSTWTSSTGRRRRRRRWRRWRCAPARRSFRCSRCRCPGGRFRMVYEHPVEPPPRRRSRCRSASSRSAAPTCSRCTCAAIRISGCGCTGGGATSSRRTSGRPACSRPRSDEEARSAARRRSRSRRPASRRPGAELAGRRGDGAAGAGGGARGIPRRRTGRSPRLPSVAPLFEEESPSAATGRSADRSRPRREIAAAARADGSTRSCCCRTPFGRPGSARRAGIAAALGLCAHGGARLLLTRASRAAARDAVHQSRYYRALVERPRHRRAATVRRASASGRRRARAARAAARARHRRRTRRSSASRRARRTARRSSGRRTDGGADRAAAASAARPACSSARAAIATRGVR